MPDEGIRDRADDTDGCCAEARIQFVFEIDNIGRAVAGRTCQLIPWSAVMATVAPRAISEATTLSTARW